LKVYFKDSLDASDLDKLDAVIAAHVPEALPDTTELRATDNRMIVKPSIRPLLSYGCFTNPGDNIAIPGDKGGDSVFMKIDHKIGDPASQPVEQSFNVEGNRSWVWDGFIQWKNANFDYLTFEIRTRPTTYTTATGTNFYKSSSGVILPVSGTGNITISDTLVEVYPVSTVPKTDTGVCPAAYWNLTYSNGVYSNLTPAPTGNGKYNLFWADACLKRYINKFVMLGDGTFSFLATDPSELGTNLRLVYTFTTNTPDHGWQACVNISMFREKIS
jgi:hypothetical protein